MNILYANESFSPQYDGVAVCTENYANIINKKYGKSYVLVPAHGDRVESDFGFDVLQCPSSKLTIANQYKVCLPMPPKLKNKIDKLPIDLVHSHCPFVTGILSMKIARQNNVPHISTFHSKYKDDINQRLRINMELPGEMVAKYVAAYYNKCDYVWTLNQGTANTLKQYGYKGDVTIMPNGCDMPVTFRNDEVRKSLAVKYGIDSAHPILLFVGRLTYLKNIHLIVEALAALKRRGKDFSMMMVGGGEDEEKLKERVKKLGLDKMVIFTGKILDRQELRDIYSSSDLFVFPSVYDNAPLVVREAAACGLPSLLIRGSNSAEGVLDGHTGILTEEKVEDIALAINEAITNSDLRLMGERARDTIYLTWDEVVEKAVNEYQRIIDEYRTNKPEKKTRHISFSDIDLSKDFNLNIHHKIKKVFMEYLNQE